MLPIGVTIEKQPNGEWRICIPPYMAPAAGSLSRGYETYGEALDAARQGIYD